MVPADEIFGGKVVAKNEKVRLGVDLAVHAERDIGRVPDVAPELGDRLVLRSNLSAEVASIQNRGIGKSVPESLSGKIEKFEKFEKFEKSVREI